MHDKMLGFFEDPRRKKFSMKTFQGIFRNARGSSPPFIYVYESPEDYPPGVRVPRRPARGVGLPLFPMLVCGIDKGPSHQEEPDFFLYDIVRQDGREIASKAVQERTEVTLDNHSLPELFADIAALLSEDPAIEPIRDIRLVRRSLD